jgi:hypothetical protein
MKSTSLALLSLLFAAPLLADSGEHLIPAGSLIQCTVAEPHISSKTTAIGDPVLCQVGHSERYGRSVMPYDSYLVGRFEDYKDPGHFVGKGWMELKFDHMVIEPNTTIPLDARVVDVPGYKVDNQGRILGKGHVKRDVAMWSIPVLWPLDLLMMPMRGPRPTLKEETRLTLKVMNDIGIPATEPLPRDPYGLIPRGGPSAENDAPPPPVPDQGQYQDPNQGQYQGQYQDPNQGQAPMPVAQDYPPPMPVAPPAYGYGAPPPPMYAYAGPPPAYFGFGYVAPRYGYGAPVRGYGYGAGAPRGYGYGAPVPRYGAPVQRYGYGAPAAGRYGYGAGQMRAGAPMRSQGGMTAMRGGGGGMRAGGGMGMRGGGGRSMGR